MEPTQQQIETAARMQELGLCQDAEEWIRYKESEDSERIYEIQPSKYRCKELWISIGPLASAAVCWPEIEQLASTKYLSLTITSNVLILGDKFDNALAEWCIDIGFNEAFRQTLIYLKEKKK